MLTNIFKGKVETTFLHEIFFSLFIITDSILSFVWLTPVTSDDKFIFNPSDNFSESDPIPNLG